MKEEAMAPKERNTISENFTNTNQHISPARKTIIPLNNVVSN